MNELDKPLTTKERFDKLDADIKILVDMKDETISIKDRQAEILRVIITCLEVRINSAIDWIKTEGKEEELAELLEILRP